MMLYSSDENKIITDKKILIFRTLPVFHQFRIKDYNGHFILQTIVDVYIFYKLSGRNQ